MNNICVPDISHCQNSQCSCPLYKGENKYGFCVRCWETFLAISNTLIKFHKFCFVQDFRLSDSITKLNLSTRAYNCLARENIFTLKDLVERTGSELMNIKDFGKTTLKEVQYKLQTIQLHLGMEIIENVLILA